MLPEDEHYLNIGELFQDVFARFKQSVFHSTSKYE